MSERGEKMLVRQIIAQDMGLNPDDFETLDPADFELADWPNSYQDLEGGRTPCTMCGHDCRFIAGYIHKPSGELFAFGQDCESYIDSENKGHMEFKKLRTAAKNKEMEAKALAEWTRRNDEFRADFPHVAAFLDGIDRDKERFDFLVSMIDAYERFGGLTERQTAAVEKIMKQRENFDRQARERAEAPEPTNPAPEGKQMVEGIIVSMKFYESEYNNVGSWKMSVVLDDGNKVWGTCPASIESKIEFGNLRERLASGEYKPRVRFSANFTPKDGEDHFSYFKNPTKGEVL
jgi:hypothetical protein